MSWFAFDAFELWFAVSLPSISNRREAGEVFVQSVYKSLEGNTTRTQCDTADHAGDCFGTKTGVAPATAYTRGIAVFPDPSYPHIKETVMVTVVEWDNVPLSALMVTV